MSDDRFCRFATKLVVNGVTLIDGVLSHTALNILVNQTMVVNGLPTIDLSRAYAWPEGEHIHYDIAVQNGFIAFEVSVLAPPVVQSPNITAGPSAP